MADIFISYASDDRARIAPIVHALKTEGWSVFWDRDTPIGMSWDRYIEQELSQAACVVAIWTKISVDKNWVKIEARNALDRNCLVPVRIDPVSPPFGFELVQSADLLTFDGDTAHPEWHHLVAAIERLVTQTPGAQRQETAGSSRRSMTDPRHGLSAGSRKVMWSIALALLLLAAAATLVRYVGSPLDPMPQKTTTEALPTPELVSVMAGCFTMGSPKGEKQLIEKERPQHQVCLEAFLMGRHEVTFEQYDTFADATDHDRPDDASWRRRDRPVINVNWDDAQDYAKWLSTKLDSDCGLPSEAQWEYAARATSTTAYALPAPGGSDDITNKVLANCDGCGSQWDRRKTAPVGSFAANAWGLHDMHGNVWEWVQDCWHG